MAKFVLTKKALKDLSDIWNYTFDNWSEKQADKYHHEILQECKNLSKNPEKGKKYYNILSDLKGDKINRHIIFYREIGEETIEIERVLHQRMDLKTRIEE